MTFSRWSRDGGGCAHALAGRRGVATGGPDALTLPWPRVSWVEARGGGRVRAPLQTLPAPARSAVGEQRAGMASDAAGPRSGAPRSGAWAFACYCIGPPCAAGATARMAPPRSAARSGAWALAWAATGAVDDAAKAVSPVSPAPKHVIDEPEASSTDRHERCPRSRSRPARGLVSGGGAVRGRGGEVRRWSGRLS
jgi:hypothetical protein